MFIWPGGYAEVDVVALPLNNLSGSLCIWLRGFLKQVDILCTYVLRKLSTSFYPDTKISATLFWFESVFC